MTTLYEALLRVLLSLVLIVGVAAVWCLLAIAVVALWEVRS